jgi:DNA-binding NarL/FixJ family response regulator
VGKILWADDEPWFQESLRYGLENAGHQVDYVVTVDDAKQRLQASQSERYDLVICDIGQPVETWDEQLTMDAGQLRRAAEKATWGGVDIYRAVRADFPDLPILVYSVVPEGDIRSHAPDIEFDCVFLRKGVPRDEFLATVERILKR